MNEETYINYFPQNNEIDWLEGTTVKYAEHVSPEDAIFIALKNNCNILEINGPVEINIKNLKNMLTDSMIKQIIDNSNLLTAYKPEKKVYDAIKEYHMLDSDELEEKILNRIDEIVEHKLKPIAKQISELEDMPNDSSFYKTAVMVAQDLYGATQDEAIKIAEIIEEEYL